MLVKLFYILFFAASTFIIYDKIHKVVKIDRVIVIFFICVFVFVLLVHCLNGWPFLLPAKNFFPLMFLLISPVIFYLWFTYIVLPRVSRLKEKGMNENFANSVLKLFSFFFTKLPFFMCFLAECMAIIEWQK